MERGGDRDRWRESQARIRELLAHEWDPIGASGVEGAGAEYDIYVGEIYALLVDQGAAAQDIEAHLFDIATNRIGLADTIALRLSCRSAAEALVAVLPSLTP